MNSTYRRYLDDDGFRADLLAAARRDRARAIVTFFSSIAATLASWRDVMRAAGTRGRMT